MDATPVTVAIRSRQTLHGETFRLDQQAAGTLTATAEGWCLRYGPPPGEDGETQLHLQAGEIQLARSGAHPARMRFQPGAAHPARYETAWGTLDLSVETEYLGHALTERGGQILLRYRLFAQGQDMGRFVLQLQIRSAQAET